MKTELDKCMAGEWYDCHDPIFITQKGKTRQLLARYNALPYEEKKTKQEVLKEMFGSIGNNVSVGTPFLCDYSCEWSNGYSFFIGFLYRVIPADGVCLPCAFLTDGRLLRLIQLFVLVRIPFEKIKLRPLVVGTDESTEQVPLVVGHALDAGRLTLCQ